MKKYPHGITLAAVCSAIDAYKTHEDDVPEIGILNAFEILLADSDVGKKLQALAAENVLMLKLMTDISENHVEYFSEGEGYTLAGVPLDYVSEINTYVSRDVNAENPFPATDAYLNSVRAEGVEMFGELHDATAEKYRSESPGCYGEQLHQHASSQAVKFAAQLRAGKESV